MRSWMSVRRSILGVIFLSAVVLVPAFAAEQVTERVTAAPGPAGCVLESQTFGSEIAPVDEVGICPADPEGAETDLFGVEAASPAAGPDGLAAAPTAKPPRPLGFCRCGCGIRCRSSADCGGSSCDRFITCC